MRKIFLFIFLFSSVWLYAQNYTQIIEQFANKSYFRRSNIGVFIKDLNTQKILVNYGTEKFMIPASIQKLFTTYAALETFGKDHHFVTTLSYNGIIKDSVLWGNIIVKGYGDPTLGSGNFHDTLFLQNFVNAIRGLGIKRISGDIIADANYFPPTVTPRKWTWEDLGNYYGAPPTAICVFDNMYKIFFRTGKPGTYARIIRVEPPIPQLNIKSYVRAANIRSDQSFIIGAPQCFERQVVGRLPAYRKEYVVKGAIPDPPLFFAQLLKNALDTSGLIVNGIARKITENERYPMAKEFFRYYSPPLLDIIRKTNEKSINLYAEVLLKHLALFYKNTASTQAGISALNQFLSGRGIDTTQIILFDGSGLSRYNAITPQVMADFLEMVYHSNSFTDFLSTLPVAGQNGTLKYLGRGTILQNNFLAKSGSMKTVRNYAGYFLGKNGHYYVVVVMLNNFTCSQTVARREIVNFLTTIFRND